MTIADGLTILENDLNALTTAQLALMQADNAQLPQLIRHNVYFHGMIAASPPSTTLTTFVMPWSMHLMAVAVYAAAFTAASTLTITITGDGMFSAFPVQIGPLTVGVAATSLARVFYDGTRGVSAAPSTMVNNQAMRLLNQGQTITVTPTCTGSVDATSFLQVCLCFRSDFARM